MLSEKYEIKRRNDSPKQQDFASLLISFSEEKKKKIKKVKLCYIILFLLFLYLFFENKNSSLKNLFLASHTDKKQTPRTCEKILFVFFVWVNFRNSAILGSQSHKEKHP